jgi:glycosyltransferase involved in cell wall biosynthesis
MKILWHSTAPWSPSSYSVLTARAIPNIVKIGHNVAIGTWYGLQGQPLPWAIHDRKTNEQIGKVDVFPAGDGANFSMDILAQLYQYIKAEVAIVCSDVWPFKAGVTRLINFCPWLPIDHDPTPAPVIDALGTAVYPMVYSRWGRDVLAESNIEAAYVPCSAPSDVFKPGDKKAARQTLGIIDKARFIIGVIAANKDPQDRKGLSESMQAFAKFAEDHDGAYMYLHTDVKGPINILGIAQQLGVRDRIIQCDPLGYKLGMLDTAYMVNAYNACDALLNLAKSEGFGLPILEAQMCGVPVVASGFSTTDELLWAGWKVKGQKHWSPGLDSWRITANIDNATDALDAAYRARNNKTLKQEARRGALSLDTDRVFHNHWIPALAEIERIVEGGQKVYDFAKSFDGKIPTQPFSGPADRTVPQEAGNELA